MPTNSIDSSAASAPHVDSLTDKQLEAIASGAKDPQKAAIQNRLMGEIGTLDCVLYVLEQWDMNGRPINEPGCRMPSAEAALRLAIKHLYTLADDIGDLQDVREVHHG
jgi:hypothetical protein